MELGLTKVQGLIPPSMRMKSTAFLWRLGGYLHQRCFREENLEVPRAGEMHMQLSGIYLLRRNKLPLHACKLASELYLDNERRLERDLDLDFDLLTPLACMHIQVF